jgi:hypothetical protein
MLIFRWLAMVSQLILLHSDSMVYNAGGQEVVHLNNEEVP